MNSPQTPFRSRLRLADLLSAGTIGPRSRPFRAVLSALGIAIGIAAVVGVLGITRSSEANLLARIDRLGTNLLTVANGTGFDGGEAQLPTAAPGMMARLGGVLPVAPTDELRGVSVYRSDQVPSYEGGGLGVRACDPSLLTTLSGSLAHGGFLNRAMARFPTAVLGYRAAQGLGISDLTHPVRVWVGGHWFSVVGVSLPQKHAPENDRDALVGIPVAQQLLSYDGHASRIYVRTNVDATAAVASLLGRATNPESPQEVQVSQPSAALAARIAVAGASTDLFLGLGAVALLVGAIGIANVMVIGVLERRTEIGLRRALGATRRHVAAQFLGEALMLGALGGSAGIVIGAAVTSGFAASHGWQVLIPADAVWGGLGAAMAIGALAGLWPALRAARLSPTEALRSV